MTKASRFKSNALPSNSVSLLVKIFKPVVGGTLTRAGMRNTVIYNIYHFYQAPILLLYTTFRNLLQQVT